jgi:DNA (cytosine-5)-methyltransferase 1
MQNKKIKTIDLFAGIGGVRLAFEKAGFHTVFANDFEPKCANTYDINFSIPKLMIEDIKKIKPKELPNFDLLLGGFPCQPFSVAGKRQGMEDERGTLFFEIANILEERRPIGFFLENVKNLTGHNFGKTFQIILNKLNELGYDVTYAVLNSMEYGNIPQNRERVYIVGFLKKTGLIKKFEFPKQLELKKNINDILEKKVSALYYYNNKPLFDKLKSFIFKKNTIYQWRRKYVRENKSGVCPTLTANMGTGGHNVPLVMDDLGIRKLTPRECARIQGFPDTYKLPKIADSYLYKQIGNSVSVPVVYRIAKSMMLAISGL